MAGRFDSLAIFVDNNSFSFGAKCHEAVREMYEIASHDADSIHLISRCFYAEATLSFVQGISDSTLIVRLESYLEQIDKEKRPYDYALLLCSLGLFQDALGNYAEAFLNAIKALEIFRKTSDKMFIPKTLNLLGNISGHINILTMAEDYYHEALSLTDPNHLDYYRIKSNIYRLYYSKQEPQRAIDSLKTFTPIIKKKGDQGLLAINYLNLATFYFNISGYDSTYCYSIKAREILETIDNERLTAIMNHNLGIFYYFKEQDYKTALYYLRKAKEGAKEQKNHNHLYSIYYIMAHTFAGLDQYDSAFYYFNKHQNLSLNFMNNPKTIEAYQAYISTFLESSENKLTIAQQEIALKNRQFAVLVIVAVAVILLVMLLLIIAQQKRRIKDNENKKLSRQLEHEKEIQRLEKEKQEETIAAKTREITSYSLQLSNKNVILKQIMDLSSQLSSATPKEVVEINKKINAIIKSNYNLDNDWKSFKIHFDKVHPRFFDKLKEHAPGLTENNLRICAYFRIGMSNKQIAQILNISPESVIIHRHRLKKKLNLTDEENLDDFIRAL